MSDLSSPEPSAPEPLAQESSALDQRCLLVISTRSPTDCLAAIAHALPRVGGRMRALSLKPVGAQFEATLRLSSLGDAGADRAASLIAAWPNAGSVRVEHQWVRS